MSTNVVRRLAWAYAVMFLIVGSLRYVPFINDASGTTLGIFRLHWYADLLHYASAVWAATAAWYSYTASTRYFKIFGILYFLDGLMGFFLGQGYLDLGIFRFGITQLDWGFKFLANLPHLSIGGLAIFIGFYVSQQFPERTRA